MRKSLKNGRRQTFRKLVLKFDIGVTTKRNILSENMKMNIFFANIYDFFFNLGKKDMFQMLSRAFHPRHIDVDEQNLDSLITTDEIRIPHSDPKIKQQSC